MKKKYQVFISSTYTDLIDERAAATQCLLDIDCIPVGMEQFPASNMEQMEYIKKMLDDCDYYILILGGRYGSLDNEGIGYTEREYDYAVAHGIPIMTFVFDHPENLPSKYCEQSDELRKKFADFRAKVCAHKMVKFHSDIGSLKANIVTAVSHCIKHFPAIGWVRNDGKDQGSDLLASLDAMLTKHRMSDTERDGFIERIRSLEEEVKAKPTLTEFLNEAGGTTIVIDGGTASEPGRIYIAEDEVVAKLKEI